MRRRQLDLLFNPRAVAILGASSDPNKWGHWLARGALRGIHRRSVYLVNRTGESILGHRVFRSLGDLPEPVDLVVLAVPATGFEAAVSDALAAHAKAIVAISAGLGETGTTGVARERAMVEKVRDAGAILLGPNCLGVFDAEADLHLAANDLPAGSIGIVSQSGNIALEIGLLARQYGLGFSKFVSLGNQADLEAAELVSHLVRDPHTRLLALYCEDFRDGRAFVAAAAEAAEAGKPVVLLSAGNSKAGARAARSHTGALVSDARALQAACEAAGVITVTSSRELVDAAQGLLAGVRPSGQRVGILGDGGGHGVVACDAAAAAGFDTPVLSEPLKARLNEMLPATATTENPVDLAGVEDVLDFARATRTLLDSDEVDAVVLTGFFGGYAELSPELQQPEIETAVRIAEAARETRRPVVAQTMFPFSDAAQALRSEGVPVYRDIDAAFSVLARCRTIDDARLRPLPEMPAAAKQTVEDGGYFAVRALLGEAGMRFVRAHEVRTAEEAEEVAEALGYPVVLKALGLLHKSDVGGVVLGLANASALKETFSELSERLRPTSFSVEQTASVEHGVELIIGTRWDLRFGPTAYVGLGGLYAELFDDVAVGLAPLDLDAAGQLLTRLRGAPLLFGARGRPRLATETAAAALVSISRVAAEHPEIRELEVNPLLVGVDDALGLDASALLANDRTPDVSTLAGEHVR